VPESTRSYHRATVSALLSILERVATGGEQLSHAENVLFAACEIWAAAGTGTLADVLGPESTDGLRTAAMVFVTVGALQTAAMLRGAADATAVASGARERLKSLEALGARLRGSTEPVDRLIARYAASVVSTPVGRDGAGHAIAGPPAPSNAPGLVLH
jgi:hypothetical protein